MDCSQLQDASIKPLCRVCSQKLKFLWPFVSFIVSRVLNLVVVYALMGPLDRQYYSRVLNLVVLVAVVCISYTKFSIDLGHGVLVAR